MEVHTQNKPKDLHHEDLALPSAAAPAVHHQPRSAPTPSAPAAASAALLFHPRAPAAARHHQPGVAPAPSASSCAERPAPTRRKRRLSRSPAGLFSRRQPRVRQARRSAGHA